MQDPSETFQEILDNGWAISPAWWGGLSDYMRDFAYVELGKTRSWQVYEQRVRQIDFVGLDKVLDAGCGIGQWSLILSCLNQQVIAQDISPERLVIAKQLAALHSATNIQFCEAAAESSGLANASVDAVFCYGVFMFTDMQRSLAEFHRILKPNGKLYINANTWGWYLHLVLDRSLRNRSLDRQGLYSLAQRWGWLRASAEFIIRAWLGQHQKRVVTEAYLRKHLQGHFIPLSITPEGYGGLRAGQSPHPFYPPKLYGLPTMLEVLAVKE